VSHLLSNEWRLSNKLSKPFLPLTLFLLASRPLTQSFATRRLGIVVGSNLLVIRPVISSCSLALSSVSATNPEPSSFSTTNPELYHSRQDKVGSNLLVTHPVIPPCSFSLTCSCFFSTVAFSSACYSYCFFSLACSCSYLLSTSH
jgi:hypothetical protein